MNKQERLEHEQLKLQLDDQKRRYADEIGSTKELAVVALRMREATELLLRALSVRLLATLALLADFALFAWAVNSSSWISLVAATLFGVASWCVLYLKPPDRKERGHEQQTEEGTVPP